MKSLILNLDNSSEQNLYVQIYNLLKNDILSGSLEKGTKLPSLRKLAKENDISVTTVETAYTQLLVEGYIESRPKSGYYVSETIQAADAKEPEEPITLEDLLPTEGVQSKKGIGKEMIYDEESFEFSKWKKCMNRVFNEYSHLLQTEADVKGEPALRYEICKYLYQSRGVKCTPEQVVIGAGSQQLALQLTRILREIGVDNAATETPGYGPIRDIFKEAGFPITEVEVGPNGIELEKLPTNLRSIVYVNPSNQFPSGAVMPIGRRYDLIKWAKDNDSYILEDDYDSELRYFGKPIPAMQGLDNSGKVIYLGSFSSTLFASIKISYMVLPQGLVNIFEKMAHKYSQTCSKAEQICLALYMEEGFYYRHIKKLRRMYASKLETTIKMVQDNGAGRLEAIDSRSGIAVMLKVRSKLQPDIICKLAKDLGLTMYPVDDLCDEETKVVNFYFYRVPESLLKLLIKMFVQNLKKLER
ncbi:MAG: PLP-dependent aminotransferase family protein [Firmicutes bacterium]|nr:PLP-dependent aminotransferase family protein [Bacillota bacterium]